METIKKAMVVSIQRCSLHDGYGLRTTVFLKGCNMHCYWCHNPETFSMKKQLSFDANRCIGCGECFKVCPKNAHQYDGDIHIIDRKKCALCGQCVDACYAQALEMIGKQMSVEEVFQEIIQDEAFYENSGGGVTVSGGEPLIQDKFVYELLKLCKMNGIHTAIETNMAVDWERIKKVLSVTDLVMADIKIMDENAHIQATGMTNKQLLENIKKIGSLGKDLIVRTPIIPGFNATVKDISAIAKFLSNVLGLKYYELIPYHPLGNDKAKGLNINIKNQNIEIPDNRLMQKLANSAFKHDIQVWVSSKKYCDLR